ncbi:amidase family protein [Congregibacter variabilis]|uniref:Amidase family protein n=1 Tax=Congregibacter variabilis TaxID=3081200 RepID=A0ABZ0I5M8_9GAMM|nr:amidase family protein [Congregibacter sp. IMCC43200]
MSHGFELRLSNYLKLPALLLCLLAGSSTSTAAVLQLTQASIPQLSAAMDAGTLSSEQLVQAYLDRVAAYDQQGPTLNTMMLLNPNALTRAQELDEERRVSGPRSPMHGIPVVIKDNLDTADMPTTAGSFMLAGSIPPDDAYVVKKLRDAGAIILGKLNLSEFASGGAMNSLGGVIANPHHLGRTPSGSSGGTGAAIAAGFASMGLGTDTGGSVRGPSSANGIVGLKTTHGLISRDGVVPLALSFDTVGPMTRSVTDLAIALGVMTGVDPADDSTQKSIENSYTDYSQFLDGDSLKGARIGVARVFMNDNNEVDWLVESALQAMRDAGAEVVDVEFPDWLLESRGKFYRAIRYPEFKAQIADYLVTLNDEYPKDLDGLIAEAMTLNATREDGVIPNPSRWSLMRKEVEATGLDGYEYQAVKTYALPLVAQTIDGLMQDQKLDAIVYPTASSPAELIERPTGTSEPGSGGSPVILANLSGFPDLILPIGFTGRGMPVTLSMLGTAFSEPTLIGLAFALEQRLQAIRLPVHTPQLPGDTLRGD